jgi:1,2-phenylacetyl-CoA epoxidase catalytic subunit
MADQHAAMMAKIERGVRLESADEMTPDYRDNLLHLLTMQADSELSGGYGYVPSKRSTWSPRS